MALHSGFVTSAATTALDTRLAEMGFIVRNADYTPRVGVLWDAGMNGFFAFTTAATNPMTIGIPVGSFILSRSLADGVIKITNDGTLSVPIAAAPASGSRIDVIYVKQNDSTQGDANDLPIFGAVTGTVGSGKPAIPTGALELATLTIASGTTSTAGAGATLAHTFAYTGFTGGIIPFRSLAELKAWTPESTAYARVIQPNSVLYVYDTSNGYWRPVSTVVFSNHSGTGSLASSLTEGTVGSSTLQQFTSDSDIIDASAGVPLVKVDGWYRCSVSIAFAVNATGLRGVEINGNDTQLSAVIGDAKAALSSGQTWCSATGVVFLSAGTYVKAKGFQNSGGTLNYNTTLTVELVR